jgi:hypothetical protein
MRHDGKRYDFVTIMINLVDGTDITIDDIAGGLETLSD